MPDMLALYSIAFGDYTPETIEWCGINLGPGSGQYGEGPGGARYPACPVCGGLKEPNGNFIPEAVGHREDCQLKKELLRG